MYLISPFFILAFLGTQVTPFLFMTPLYGIYSETVSQNCVKTAEFNGYVIVCHGAKDVK